MCEKADQYLVRALKHRGENGSSNAFSLALQAITRITSRVLVDDVNVCQQHGR